jgi:hypothetical protein
LKEKKKILGFFRYACLAIVPALVLWTAGPAQAFTPGTTYDKSNYQEVEKLLIPPMVNWVKKGEFILKTGEIGFELNQGNEYLRASKKNEGKYDVDKDGVLVDKASGKPVQFYRGHPFPTIDAGDANAGAKIMENVVGLRYRISTFFAGVARLTWVGKKGPEREVYLGNSGFYYTNRAGGAIDNPRNFLYQTMIYVMKPFDLRGTVQMAWAYNDARQDTSFAYVPMLRRVRRVSSATKSDPFLGSDICMDDQSGWAGKNASMTWKLIGEKTLLVPISTTEKFTLEKLPDGSIKRGFTPVKFGWESKEYDVAPWCPVTLTYIPRKVWIVESYAKDSYYNYGKMIYYIDKEAYNVYAKEIYDNAGDYWKTVLVSGTYSATADNEYSVYGSVVDTYVSVDDKTHHASVAVTLPGERPEQSMVDVPWKLLNPKHFNESNLKQFTK